MEDFEKQEKIHALVVKAGSSPMRLFSEYDVMLNKSNSIESVLTNAKTVRELYSGIDSLKLLIDELDIVNQAFEQWKVKNSQLVNKYMNGGDQVSAIQLVSWLRVAKCAVAYRDVGERLGRTLSMIMDAHFSFKPR